MYYTLTVSSGSVHLLQEFYNKFSGSSRADYSIVECCHKSFYIITPG